MTRSTKAKAKGNEPGGELLTRDDTAPHFPDSSPPEKLSGLLGEYPGLTVVAGLGLGLLAGALLPRSAGRKLARGGIFVASTAGELGLALGKQALRSAEHAAHDGREKLEGTAAEALRLATDAGRLAVDTGRKAGDEAQRFAVEASDKAKELGAGLVKLAADVASRARNKA